MEPIIHQTLLHTAPFGYAYHKVIVNDRGEPCDFEYLEANAAFEELTGLKVSEIIGKKVTQVLPDIVQDDFDWVSQLGSVALKGGSRTFEQYSTPLDRWYKVQVHAPQKGYFATLFMDITVEKNQMKELEGFFSVNLDLLCITDQEGRFLKLNSEWENVLGYTKKELLQKKFLELIHPDDLPATLQAMDQLRSNQKVLNFINRYLCKDGTYRHIEWRSHPYKNHIYAAARDITEKVLAQERLQKTKEQFELSVSGSNDGIWDWNLLTNELFLSERWKQMLGYQDHELKNEFNTFASLLHTADMERVNTYVQKYLNGEIETYEIDFRMMHKDGSIRWIAARGAALRDIQGKPYRMAGSHTDITRRKKAEEDLRQSEERFRSLVDSLNDIVFTLDTRQKFTGVFGNWMQGMELGQEAILGKTPWEVFGEKDASLHKNAGQKALQGSVVSYDWKTRVGKQVKYFQTVLSPVYDPQKKVCGLSGVGRDISSTIKAAQLEKEMEVARKTQLFTQNFLASISHEMRTPLSGILGSVNWLGKTPLDEQQKEARGFLEQSSEKLSLIIDKLLDYAQIEKGELKLFPRKHASHDLITQAEKFFRAMCHKDISFKAGFDSQIPPYLLYDKKRILQVIYNLLHNAIIFTHQGQITVDVDLESAPMNRSGKACLKVKITDTGQGIDPEKQKQLFLPFSQIHKIETQKYKGIGLGLAIAKKIVALHGGKIGVSGSPGAGSCFWFTFKASVPQPGSYKHTYPPKPKNMKILFVEDKHITQKVVQLMLSEMGHQVSLADNGQEAFTRFNPEEFDLILMDIQMPVMDGITATRQIKKQYQNPPPIVGLSANAFPGDREKYMQLGMDEYLNKPLTPEDFALLIQKVF